MGKRSLKAFKVKSEKLRAGNVVVTCVPIFSEGSWVFLESQTAVLASYKD